MDLKENDSNMLPPEKNSEEPESTIDVVEKENSLSFGEEVDHKIDYSQYSKKELLDIVKELAKENNLVKADTTLRHIKPVFEEIFANEQADALKRFIENGGIAEDFEYRSDEIDSAFNTYVKIIKDRKNQYVKQQEEQRSDNLRKKEDVLEKMRQLLDNPSKGNQYDQFQELQKQWKSIGAVPPAQAKTMWANYHALVDRFYDNQSIYFELKELDRKKNLIAKTELIKKAEKLATLNSLPQAIKELNELHHEFKHIGPVPKEQKESIWQLFKNASDVIYTRKDEFIKKQQEELRANLDKKLKIIEDILPFADFKTDRIKEWNQKTTEILYLQKQWEQTGQAPRNKAKEINRKFWAAFKSFFSAKSNFFKKLDAERNTNLKQKQDLLAKANELKDNEDWEKTSVELMSLQQEWKKVGPIPEKVREKIFQEFKSACDHFFDRKRSKNNKEEVEQKENLKLKEAICNTLETTDKEAASREKLYELQAQFASIGFVPRNAMQKIRSRYTQAVEKYAAKIDGMTENEKTKLSFQAEFNDLKTNTTTDSRVVQHREQVIRKKIGKIENDIALWRNNLEFFARSKNADALKNEFNQKIQQADRDLKDLKKQLQLIRTVL